MGNAWSAQWMGWEVQNLYEGLKKLNKETGCRVIWGITKKEVPVEKDMEDVFLVKEWLP